MIRGLPPLSKSTTKSGIKSAASRPAGATAPVLEPGDRELRLKLPRIPLRIAKPPATASVLNEMRPSFKAFRYKLVALSTIDRVDHIWKRTSHTGRGICLALTITGLSKTYPNGVKALKNLSLTIGNNMFGLLGPNGAGKSTLMRTVATLQDPDSGTIFLDGIDVLKEKDTVRKLLGYLPQEFGVYPKLSALDLLTHLAALKGVTVSSERKDTVDALLKQTNLWDARKKALSTYSGGMKQRFGIAQALLANPKLIIVDEPTAGLDPAERNRFLNLLSSIASNVTVILSTHIVDDVRELCSRMAIISNGEVLLEGSPAETLAALDGHIWSKIVATDAELLELEKSMQVISTLLVGGLHEVRVYSDSSPGEGFKAVDSELEDVYFLNLARQAKN